MMGMHGGKDDYVWVVLVLVGLFNPGLVGCGFLIPVESAEWHG